MHQTGDNGVFLLGERVFQAEGTHGDFVDAGDRLFPDGVIRVIRIDERQIIRGNGEGISLDYRAYLRLLFRRQGYQFDKLL